GTLKAPEPQVPWWQGSARLDGATTGEPSRREPAREPPPAHTRDVGPDRLPPTAADRAQSPTPLHARAARMLRRPRPPGIPPGGMGLCDRPVLEVCAVEWARMPGRTVLQWDKDDCADAGLVKFDLLGLGMLTALRIGFELVREHEGVELELHSLPQEDPA